MKLRLCAFAAAAKLFLCLPVCGPWGVPVAAPGFKVLKEPPLSNIRERFNDAKGKRMTLGAV